MRVRHILVTNFRTAGWSFCFSPLCETSGQPMCGRELNGVIAIALVAWGGERLKIMPRSREEALDQGGICVSSGPRSPPNPERLVA